MESCIYEGRVAHCRLTPRRHEFNYSVRMLYLDLAELPQVLKRTPFLSDRRFSPASYLRRDHIGDPADSLDTTIRDMVAERTGQRPNGPIRLLTQVRCFGYYFSPLNLFYCFDSAGESVEAIVADVSNTPWLERHSYVLSNANRTSAMDDADSGPIANRESDDAFEPLAFRHPKTFHVSPFMDMDSTYDWRLETPGRRNRIYLATLREGKRFFAARMSLERRELTGRNMFFSLVRQPWMTGKIIAAIYFQAFRLWMKKCPYYPHPNSLKTSTARIASAKPTAN